MKRLIERVRRKAEKYPGSPVIARITFIILGILTTTWFLVRVIPKPQRAAYPCMRATAPLMSGFVVYLLTLTGSFRAMRLAGEYFRKSRYLLFGFFFFAAAIGGLALLIQSPVKIFASTAPEWVITPNQPTGAPKGIFPGRVSWVHDPRAAQWDGSTGFWWDDKYNPQEETDKMMKQTLLLLTGEKNGAKAWEELFKSYNKTHNGKASGYRQTQKIAVKINENNNSSQESSNEINASPQLTLSLLRSLVNDAGIPQKNITIFDASRFITNNIYDKCHSEFPDVIFVDNVGGNGRIKATYVDNAIPYSADNGKLARGLASCATEADYLINVALLKGHVGQGVTLCGKNYYGVTSIYNDWRKNAHDNFNQDREGKPKYMTFVDFMGHRDLGARTMLFIIDGLYGAKLVNGIPTPKWQMTPFNNNWPCSIFASQDGIAVDAVGLDFLRCEWPDMADIKFSDQYLIEAALADNPPSKTKYDPERDGTTLTSLGVMEHWNNPIDKKYCKNLGKNNGIELLNYTIN